MNYKVRGYGHCFEIVAKNGKKIAETTTEQMANKVAKGLALYDSEQAKKKSFTV